jgi:hypothetical protein
MPVALGTGKLLIKVRRDTTVNISKSMEYFQLLVLCSSPCAEL